MQPRMTPKQITATAYSNLDLSIVNLLPHQHSDVRVFLFYQVVLLIATVVNVLSVYISAFASVKYVETIAAINDV